MMKNEQWLVSIVVPVYNTEKIHIRVYTEFGQSNIYKSTNYISR